MPSPPAVLTEDPDGARSGPRPRALRTSAGRSRGAGCHLATELRVSAMERGWNQVGDRERKRSRV